MKSESKTSLLLPETLPVAWLDQMQQALIVVDADDSKILYTNEAACTLLQHPADSLHHKPIEALFPCQKSATMQAGSYYWETLLAGGEVISAHVALSPLMGKYWLIQPLSLENGVEVMLNQLQTPVLVVNEGVLLYGNRAFSELASLPFADLQGRALGSLFDPSSKALIENYQPEAEAEAVWEANLLVEEQNAIDVELRVKQGLYLGQNCLWLTLQDITKRKVAQAQQMGFQRQLQEQLEYSSLIFDQLPIGAWLIDFQDLKKEGNNTNPYHQQIGFSLSIRLVNTKIQEMLGFTLNELAGKSIFDPLLVDAGNADIFAREIIQRRQGSRGSYEITLNSKAGEPIPVLLESIPILKNETGETIQSVGLLVDLRERKRWESELTRLNEKLENLSRTDALTGLGNRRTFDDHLLREWELAKREGSEISLIMIDVDYFKKYNDHYGHLGGDQCLVRLADLLQKQFRRAGDVVTRYGGEEFAVILPKANQEKAKALAEQVRAAVEGAQIKHAKSTVAEVVTLSLGVSTLQPKKGDDHKELVHLADEALYQSKAAGRNRTTLI